MINGLATALPLILLADPPTEQVLGFTPALILTIALIIMLMIFANGLYVGAEFATVGARKTRVRQLAGSGNKLAQRLLPVMEDYHRLDDYVATCQLGITITSLVLGAVGTSQITNRLALVGSSNYLLVFTIVLLFLTLLQVVFGELFPKSVAVQMPEQLAMWTIYPILLSQFIMRPLIFIFNGSARAIMRVLGLNEEGGHATYYSSEEIEILVGDSNEGGLIDDDERTMLRNAFRLDDLVAKEVMVHRTKIVAAPHDNTVRQILDTALEAGFSRIPIYENSIDNILGFLHVKDLFRLLVNNETDFKKSLRKVIYVPESMEVPKLWERLNQEGQYIAIVFDEHGGTEGMITQEDLIEEIFGELQDEYDNEAPLMHLEGDRVHLRADQLVKDINEQFDIELPIDIADTIGGLVFSKLDERPKLGDEITVNNVNIRVETLDDIRVGEISIPKQNQSEGEA